MPMKTTPIELTYLYDTLNIPEEGRRYIEAIRHGEPVRRVERRQSNVNVRFASNKMRLTIHCESRTVEYPFSLLCELDENVLEYFDQAAILKLVYVASSGKRHAHNHVPDFFVISDNWIGFVECKTETELIKLEALNPNRYCRDDAGNWICPPGEAAARNLGIGYRLHHPGLLSSYFVRNAEFIYDYMLASPSDKSLEIIEKIQKVVKRKRYLNLQELHSQFSDHDSVYWAIATRRIHFDFQHDLLVRPETAYVYAEPELISAIRQTSLPGQTHFSSITIEPASELIWDGNCWTVCNIGNGTYSLKNSQQGLITLTLPQIAGLIRDGNIKVIGTAPSENPAIEHLLRASPDDLARANQILAIVREAQQGRAVRCSPRTLRHWRKKADESEKHYGNPLIGLIPKVHLRGNRNSKISSQQAVLIKSSLSEDFLSATHRSIKAAYRHYEASSHLNCIPAASYSTYCAHTKRLSAYTKELQRSGKRAAYQTGATHESDLSLPPHGDRVFEVAHVDHTPLELELVSAMTGEPLGRPWLTILIDAYSRVVLGHFLTFENPSYRSTMMVIRDCVRRHGRLPQKIVVDGGAEFASKYFESLTGSMLISLLTRPPAEPRYGAPVERQFGTTQTAFIHDLSGNTQNRRLGRTASATHAPEKLAVWTPDAFDEQLSEWFYQIYPKLHHSTLLTTPEELFSRSFSETGSRGVRFFPYNELFLLLTMPAGPNTTLRSGVLKFRHCRYTSNEAINSDDNGKKIPTKYDPYDATIMYGYTGSRWMKFRNSHPLVTEYIERNVKNVHMEIISRGMRSGKAYRKSPDLFIRFLIENRERERLLLSQRNKNLLDHSTSTTQPTSEQAINRVAQEDVKIRFIDLGEGNRDDNQ